MSTLRKQYQTEVIPEMMEEFGYDSEMRVPRIEKVVVNMGIGDARDNPSSLESAVNEMAIITGQRPIVNRARKSVSAFKIREGDPVGCSVTLRREHMWSFLSRLTNVALPRVRDFRGLNPDAFDGRGNYSLGLREQAIFPEISYDEINEIRGMDVTIVTSAETDEEARYLLRRLGLPLRGADASQV
ncbi:MAG: 50S ribosomal protein L5 [Clostridia bacterium]